LKSSFKQIESDACHEELKRFFAQGSEDIHSAPDTYGACVDDVSRLCPEVSPGQGRIHECLVENKDELSEECHVAEFEQLAMQSIDIRLSPTAMRACKSDMGRLCSKAMKACGGA